MYTPDLVKKMEDYCEIINKKLLEYLPSAKDGQDNVVKAMKYSLLNGGKRLRPILVMEFCRACGCSSDYAVSFACAIEYIHTYSLIHDDLPCMDDDDFRRGNPSCHKMYGEDTALLAGDALLTHAFDILADAPVSDAQIVKAVCLLSQNSGVGGMLGGQVIDLKYEKEDPNLSQILTIHKLKTGALISAACLLGCIAADADEEKMAAASRFAYNLGIAFQIKDDLLDVFGDEQKLGKPVGSDKDNDKTTYVTIVGAEKAQADVQRLTEKAIKELSVFQDTEFLTALSQYLISREK